MLLTTVKYKTSMNTLKITDYNILHFLLFVNQESRFLRVNIEKYEKITWELFSTLFHNST